MGLAKLDTYEYTLYSGIIRIHIEGSNDPDLVDIMSDISQSNGNIYLDGAYYTYLDKYEIGDKHIDLHVVEQHIK